MMSLGGKWNVRVGCLILVASASLAQVPPMLAQELAATEVSWTEIADDVYLLEGSWFNVVAVTGPDGVLLIDSGPAEEVERLSDEIAELDAGPVQFVINTHLHFDHVGGNEHFAEDGATIIAHDKTRERMLTEWQIPDRVGMDMPFFPPHPEAALPTLTSKASTTAHLDGQVIEVIKLPDGHSDTDVAVFIQDSNVLHVGDVFFHGFPFIDTFHRGSVAGLIAEVGALIDLANDNTVVVPGHGPMLNRLGLREYREMLQVSRDRIATLIEEGKSLEEAVAADPTAGLYPHGEPVLPPEGFVRLVYLDLADK